MRKRRNASRGGSLRWLGWVLVLALLTPPAWAKKQGNDRKTEVKVVYESVKIEPPTLFETNRRLPPRQRVLVQQGEPGEKRIEWRITLRNGKEVKREKVWEAVIHPAQPRIYEVGVYA
ncbi:MAG: G5 domain-containing protein, partial [Fimbriimonadales bacterium]